MSTNSGDDQDGISLAARGSALASLMEEEPGFVLRHYQGRNAKQTLCGGTDGYKLEDELAGVTCNACLVALRARKLARMSRAEVRRVLRKAGDGIREENRVAARGGRR